MSKKVITKIAMDEIHELLNRIDLNPQEPQQILFKGAYIRLYETNIFKGEEGKKEIQVKYYRIFDNKVFYFRTFFYNFSNERQKSIGHWFYDIPSSSIQIIRPSMDLENVLNNYKEVLY